MTRRDRGTKMEDRDHLNWITNDIDIDDSDNTLNIGSMRFRDVLSSLPEGVAIGSLDETLEFANQSFADILGLPLKEVLGTSLLDYVKEEDKGLIKEETAKRRSGEISAYEIEVIDSEGETKTLRVSSVPRKNENNEIDGTIAVFVDITEQKNYEEELKTTSKKREEMVRELVCLYSTVRLLTDPRRMLEEVLFQLVNLIPEAWRFPNVTAARIECLGQVAETANFSESKWEQRAEITVLGEPIGEIVVYCQKEMPEENEGPFRKQERDLLDTIAIELGRFIERQLDKREIDRTTREIICLRTVSQILADTERPIEDILLNIVNVVMTSLQYPSSACVRIRFQGHDIQTPNFGISPWNIRSPILVSKEEVGFIEAAFLEEKPEKDDGPFLKQEKHLLDTIANDIGRYLVRKEAIEQREQKHKELEIYSSLLRHDLGNDLHVIQNYLEMVQMITVGEDSEMLRMVHSALALSQRMAGLLKALSRRPDDFEQEISKLVPRIASQSEEATVGMTIDVKVSEEVVGVRVPVSRLLPAVFENLFRNSAAHAGEEPTVDVILSKKNEFVEIIVSDDGPGIPEQVKDKLFERGTTTKGGGLGLFLSRQIVKAIGGSIELTQIDGKGASFRILLPIVG